MGENLLGRQVTVTFDTAPARVLFVSEKQLNLHVPAELAGRRTAQLRITVDGTQSAPIAVEVAAAAPGVFRNGVLNENGSVNSEAAAALTGSVLQVFATGLPAGGEISAKIHDREIVAPYYAGPAPGVDGVQQVNFAVPEDLPTMPTELLVCATVSGQKVCSAPVVVHLRNPDF
jgi:uncharacterized protein (TIGR03437 family)